MVLMHLVPFNVQSVVHLEFRCVKVTLHPNTPPLDLCRALILVVQRASTHAAFALVPGSGFTLVGLPPVMLLQVGFPGGRPLYLLLAEHGNLIGWKEHLVPFRFGPCPLLSLLRMVGSQGA